MNGYENICKKSRAKICSPAFNFLARPTVSCRSCCESGNSKQVLVHTWSSVLRVIAPTNQPYRPLELLVRPERDASSGSQVRAIILGLVPTLVSSCGIQVWGPDLGSSWGPISGDQFWGLVLGSIFGVQFWGRFSGPIFGVQFWGRFLGSRFCSNCGVDFWGPNEFLLIFLIRPNSRAQFWHPKVGPNSAPKSGSTNILQNGAPNLAPKNGADLTPQKMVQIWSPNEGPDLAPKRADLAPNLEDQIWRP